MCNLYRVRTNAAEVARLFNAEPQAGLEWKQEIYPRYSAPVVRESAGKRLLEPMTWGFPTQVQGKTKMLTKHVTNARNLSSPFWKSAANSRGRRCLVPFTQFAEAVADIAGIASYSRTGLANWVSIIQQLIFRQAFRLTKPTFMPLGRFPGRWPTFIRSRSGILQHRC